MAKNSTEKS